MVGIHFEKMELINVRHCEERAELIPLLFHEGFYNKSYRYFGVQKLYGKYSFRVWAPDATKVYLLLYVDGTVKEHLMESTENKDIWEVFIYTHKIQNATFVYKELEGVCYRYKIVTKNGEYIRNDPYSYAFSDDDCSMIKSEDYFSFTDSEWQQSCADFKGEDFSIQFNVIRLDLKSLIKDIDIGKVDYKKIEKVLVPFLKRMKYSYVLIPPANSCVITDSGEYYSKNLFSINQPSGKSKTFKSLVDKLHEHGIGVIMDFVPSYYVDLEYGLTNFNGSSVYDGKDCSDINEKGIKRFNFSNGHIISYLVAAACYWLDEFHIDGLNIKEKDISVLYDFDSVKCSVSSGIDGFKIGGSRYGAGFLIRLNEAVRDQFPKRFIMTECHEYLNKSLSFNSDINSQLFFGIKSNWISDLERFLKIDDKNKLLNDFNPDHLLTALQYDIFESKEPLVKSMLRCEDAYKVLRVFKVLQMTLPGKKYEVMGDDIGNITTERFVRNDEPETFEHHDKAMYTHFVHKLNSLYESEMGLYDNDCHKKGFAVIENRDGQILVYKRISESGDELVVAVNLSVNATEELVIPAQKDADYYKKIFYTEDKNFGGTSSGLVNAKYRIRKTTLDFKMLIPPMSAIILKPEKSCN